MKQRSIVILEAPTNLGLKPPVPGREPGTRKAPDMLRELGLHERLKPREVVRVEVPPYAPDDARAVNVRNVQAIAEHAVRLADAIETAVRSGHFPLVLGGDCSVLVGAMVGMRRLGPAGLLFVDGHTDFYLPEQSSTGGAAGMDLALATGWGPVELTAIEGPGPYVDAKHVAALGNRDEITRSHADIPDIDRAGFHYRPLEALRREGIEQATRTALSVIGAGQRRHWIHLDVDVIDSALMPAVDSPQPGGLSWGEVEALLRAALTDDAIGMEVTIYDPDRDPDRMAGRGLVYLLTSVIG